MAADRAADAVRVGGPSETIAAGAPVATARACGPPAAGSQENMRGVVLRQPEPAQLGEALPDPVEQLRVARRREHRRRYPAELQESSYAIVL